MVAEVVVAFAAAVVEQDLQRLLLVQRALQDGFALPPAAAAAAESVECPRAVEACESHDADG